MKVTNLINVNTDRRLNIDTKHPCMKITVKNVKNVKKIKQIDQYTHTIIHVTLEHKKDQKYNLRLNSIERLLFEVLLSPIFF